MEYFADVCQGCNNLFSTTCRTVYTDDIPLCASCRRDGLYDGECRNCGEYAVIYEGHDKCSECGAWPANWRMEVI